MVIVAHLPPPVHGSSLVASTIANYTLARTINIGLMGSLDKHGKLTFRKVLLFLKTLITILQVKDEQVLYIPTAKGATIWRDLIYLTCLKIRRNSISLYYLNKSDKKKMSLNYGIRYLTQKLGLLILTDKLLVENTLAPISQDYRILPLWSRFEYSEQEISVTKRVGFFSNNYRFKGLDIFEEIVRANPEIEFIVAGANGDYTISEYINLKPLGPLNAKEAREFYKSIDILIYPSRDDCFPLTILEALSAGVYVLGSSVGAIPSLLDEGKGKVLELSEFQTVKIEEFWPSLDKKKSVSSCATAKWNLNQFNQNISTILEI